MQCSNYYRHLIKSGEIKDDNYVMDEKGELRYLFGKKSGGSGEIRTHIKTSFLVNQGKMIPMSIKKSTPVEMTNCTAVKAKPPLLKRKRKTKKDSDTEDSDESLKSEDSKAPAMSKVADIFVSHSIFAHQSRLLFI